MITSYSFPQLDQRTHPVNHVMRQEIYEPGLKLSLGNSEKEHHAPTAHAAAGYRTQGEAAPGGDGCIGTSWCWLSQCLS
jgi:hypothetical protein